MQVFLSGSSRTVIWTFLDVPYSSFRLRWTQTTACSARTVRRKGGERNAEEDSDRGCWPQRLYEPLSR